MERAFEILVVDDEVSLASNLQDILEAEGYHVGVAHDGGAALALCRERAFDLAIVDIKLPDISGLDLINKLTEISSGMLYIIITGYASLESAIEAVREEKVIAYETKPLDLDRLLAFIRQVAARKKAEEGKEESEERLRLLIESAEDIIVMQDLEGKYLYYNAAPQYGVKASDLLGKTPFDFFEPAAATLMMKQMHQVVSSSQSMTVENQVPWQKEMLWFSDQKKPVRDAAGNVVAVLTISRNTTERKKAEEEIEIQKARFKSIFDRSLEGIVILDMKNNIIDANKGFESIYGYRTEEIKGKSLDELIV
ncbi:MAG: PAS domain S-box protein, partial [Dehalococcoidia bacterium]|nr:PAS domain S-box protein [Dehalococcoidia bacterium]